MSRQNQQIFFDATGLRSTWFNRFLIFIVSAISVLIAVFVLSIFTSPALPSVALRLEQQYLPILDAKRKRPSGEQPKLNLANERAGSDSQSSDIPRFGFYVNWDDNSFVSLRSSAKYLDVLVPEWMHLSGEGGAIALDDESHQKNISLWLSTNAPQLQVMPLINNYDPKSGKWEGEATGRLLRSAKARDQFIQNLKSYLSKGRFSGVVLDFKDVPEDDQHHFVELVRLLKIQLDDINLKVLAVLPAYEDPLEYLELVEAVDQLILLAYDQHWVHEGSGPLAGQGWFEALLDKRFERVSGNKLIVAIGSYVVDRKRSGDGTMSSVRAAWNILDESGSTLIFDKESFNSYFSYHDVSDGEEHDVWMLDGVTVFNQVAAALAMNPGGLALWRLGTEDPTVWHSFAKGRAPNQTALEDLKRLDPGNAVNYKGNGEVLKFANKPLVGHREVAHLSKYNLIVDQSLVSIPHSMMVSRWGLNREKVIALTFDDGPSSSFTPAILDVLEKKNVKATFFVVGAAAALEPEILKRIYDSGHDIGNHTFTHPDLSEISNVRLDLELNATQRVLESKLGIHSVLFRPPFVRDVEPETQGQANTLLASAALGYITIGQRIDPLDWGRPGVEEIIKRTVQHANTRRGNVVLLHDGGGDRSQTIEALPRIIDQLRADGFRFISVHELLGLQRSELMPKIGRPENIIPYVNNLGFSLVRSLDDALNALFIISIILGITRLVIISMAAFWQWYRREPVKLKKQSLPEFAVIVPAYNEQDVIVDSVRSILRSNLKNFQIVVIDDGSTDATVEILRRSFVDEPRVQLITKRNGGKASALNHAIRLTPTEVVVCIDADTQLAPDALEKLLRNFSNPKVGAVSGVVTVGNRTNLLSRFQALEYLTAQNLDRRAFELVNGIGVVPGAIGAWRRKAICDVGLFGSDTLAEDADLTIKLERADWLVVNEPEAYAVTEAPEGLRDFCNQRFRWMYGTLQVAFKHANVYLQKGAWGPKFVTLPNIFIFQFLFTLLSPIMDILLVMALSSDGWNYIQHDAVGVSQRTRELFMYWLGFQSIELASAALALALHGDRSAWRLLPLMVLQRFCYRQLIYWITIQTFFAALRGQMRGWGKTKRAGLSNIQARIAHVGRIVPAKKESSHS